MRTYVGLLLLCIALPSVGRAQQPSDDEPDFIVPARPTVSNPAEFQRPGVVQLEYGFDGDWRSPDTRSEQSTPLSIRFALTQRLLLDIDSDVFLSQRPSEGPRVTGASDQALTVQGVLVHEASGRPGVAVAYTVKLPTASAELGLGSGKFDHTITFLTSKTYRGTTIDCNAAYTAAGRAAGGGFASSALGAVAVSRQVKEVYGLQGEISGTSRSDVDPGQASLLGAFTYQVNRRLVFDTGMRFGLGPDAPRYGVFAGFTVGLTQLRPRL